MEYEEVLGLAAEGHPAAAHIVNAAAQGLGRLIADEPLREALAADRDPEAGPVDIRLESLGFNQWARGAAAVAIQRSLTG